MHFANKQETAPIQLTINLLRTLPACLLRSLPLRPFLVCAAVRMFLTTFTPRQIQLLSPPTLATYQTFIRETRARARQQNDHVLLEQLREDVEPLPDGRSHLLWIGDRTKATRFVYFLHGGGYMAPALSGHMEWCLQAYVLPSARHHDDEKKKKMMTMNGQAQQQQEEGEEERVAVAILQYTLTPSAQFPTQLCQAAAGLHHLLVTHGIKPSQLVVGGDSAGGNLTMQLLSHLLHPHPTAVAAAAGPIALAEEPLAGAFLVSPLVSGRSNTQSFRDGWACDMLSVNIFHAPRREMFHEPRGGGLDVGGYFFPNRNLVETTAFREGKGWAFTADVEETWVEGMDRIVGKLYVTCGQHEILRDQGIEIAERIRRRNKGVQVQLEVAEKEAHDFILLEGEQRKVGDATVRMRSWFSQVWA